jgi:small subunit ribosomal protein S8
MNLFNILSNGQKNRKTFVKTPFSKKNWVVLDLLLANGFIKGFFKDNYSIFVFLEYQKGSGFVSIKQISSPGKPVYSSCSKLFHYKKGLGTLIISTPKGVMTDRDARFNQLGGKMLCSIY